MMKKILLAAVGMVALTGAAHADHNYVGGKVGWTFARANVKGSVQTAVRTFSGVKKRASDSALTGDIFFGRSFSQGNFDWLLDLSVGLDASRADTGEVKVREGNNHMFLRHKLRRKFKTALGFGFQKSISSSMSAYAKASLLMGQFELQRQYYGGTAVAARTRNTVRKQKTAFGFGVTLGASKALTQDMSLSIDYSYERYQKKTIAFGGNYIGAQRSWPYTTKITPTYHTVMFGLTKKI